MYQATKPPPQKGTPQEYVIIRHTQQCTGCARMSYYSKLYLRQPIPSVWGKRPASQLTPLDKPQFNIPFSVLDAPLEVLQFCSDCVNPTKFCYLPFPPRHDPTAIVGGVPKSPEPVRAARTPQGRPKPTVGQVADLF